MVLTRGVGATEVSTNEAVEVLVEVMVVVALN